MTHVRLNLDDNNSGGSTRLHCMFPKGNACTYPTVEHIRDDLCRAPNLQSAKRESESERQVNRRKGNKAYSFFFYLSSKLAKISRWVWIISSRLPKSHRISRSVHTIFFIPRSLKDDCLASLRKGLRKTFNSKLSDSM